MATTRAREHDEPGKRVSRKSRILVALLVTAILIAISSLRREIWVGLAYRSVTGKQGFVYQRKRRPWLPGPLFVIQDQTCPRCTLGDHYQCYNHERNNDGLSYQWWFLEHYAGGALRFDQIHLEWRCICSDSSHEWNS